MMLEEGLWDERWPWLGGVAGEERDEVSAAWVSPASPLVALKCCRLYEPQQNHPGRVSKIQTSGTHPQRRFPLSGLG